MQGLNVFTSGQAGTKGPSAAGPEQLSVDPYQREAPMQRAGSALPASVTGLMLGLATALVGVRVSFLGTGPVLSMLLVVGATAFAAIASIERLSTFRLRRVDAAFILYVVVAVILEIYNASVLGNPVFVGGILYPAVFYLSFISVRLVVHDYATASPFLRAFASPLIFLAPLAVAQVLRVPGVTDFILQWVSAGGFEQRLSQGWDVRGTATVGHHTQFGGVLICLTGAVCADLLISRMRNKRARFSLVLVALVLIASVTTMTFAVIGGVAVVVLLTFLQLGARLSMLLGAVGSAIASWILFGRSLTERFEAQTAVRTGDFAWLPETLDYRMTIWVRETIPAISERPLTGWGIDVYSRASDGWSRYPVSLIWGSPESEYFRTLIASGWLGLAVQFLLLASVLFALIRVAARHSALWPIVVSFAVLLLVSTTHSHFTGEGAAFAAWPIVGVALALLVDRSNRHSKGDCTQPR